MQSIAVSIVACFGIDAWKRHMDRSLVLQSTAQEARLAEGERHATQKNWCEKLVSEDGSNGDDEVDVNVDGDGDARAQRTFATELTKVGQWRERRREMYVPLQPPPP